MKKLIILYLACISLTYKWLCARQFLVF